MVQKQLNDVVLKTNYGSTKFWRRNMTVQCAVLDIKKPTLLPISYWYNFFFLKKKGTVKEQFVSFQYWSKLEPRAVFDVHLFGVLMIYSVIKSSCRKQLKLCFINKKNHQDFLIFGKSRTSQKRCTKVP